LDNCFVFLFHKHASRGPISVIWDITAGCNLNCIFCDRGKAEKGPLSTGEKELNTLDKLKITRKLAQSGVCILSLCGGEPLLCHDLAEVIKEAKLKKMFVNVSTNGLLLEEKARMLVGAGVDSVTVSIDSHLPDNQDSWRGHKGLFRQIEKGIQAIRTLAQKKSISIEARCLINKINAFSLRDFADFWQDKVDFIIFKPIYENLFALYRIPECMRFLPQDEPKFRDYFGNFLRDYPAFNNNYNRKIPDFLFGSPDLKDEALCFAGTFFAGLNYQGNLSPCQEITTFAYKPPGNLLKEDFLCLWNSNEMNKLRAYFSKGLHCHCWMDRFILNIYLDRFLKPVKRIFKVN